MFSIEKPLTNVLILQSRYHCHSCHADKTHDICAVCTSMCHGNHNVLIARHFCEQCDRLICDHCKTGCLASNHPVNKVPKNKILNSVLHWCLSMIPKRCRNQWMRNRIDKHEELCKLSGIVEKHVKLPSCCDCGIKESNRPCNATNTKLTCTSVEQGRDDE